MDIPVPNDGLSPVDIPGERNWENILNGVERKIPDSFLQKIFIPKDSVRDRHTNLPIEDDAIRNETIARLGKCIKSGTNFACVYADADNLKVANDIDRVNLGNEVIKASSASICNAIDSLNLSGASIIAARATHAADETKIWLFDLTDGQLKEVNDLTEQLNRKREKVSIPPKIDDPERKDTEFSISISVDSVNPKTPNLTAKIAQTKEFLEGSTDVQRLPYDLHTEIENYADISTKFKKMAKGIYLLPIDQLGKKRSDEIMNALADSLVGVRGIKPVLMTIMTIARDSGKMDDLASTQSREMISEKTGWSSEEISIYNDEELSINYYDWILHTIYEEAGFSTA